MHTHTIECAKIEVDDNDDENGTNESDLALCKRAKHAWINSIFE